MNASHDRAAPDRVRIFDTTLRDGEQSPGFTMSAAQKIAFAHALADLGVDVIEAGFPNSSPADFGAVQTIAKEVRGASIAGLARCHAGDIEACARALAAAAAILLPLRWPRLNRLLALLTLVLAAAACAAGAYIAYPAGKIRHREFRHTPPPPPELQKAEQAEED